jgi:hypothetical protein
MPRLSMWRENHSNDYKFFDKRISEEFTIGGTGVYLHKYLGTSVQANAYAVTSEVTANTAVLSFANVAIIDVGQSVSGVGIATNTTITAKNLTANTVTLSSNVTETIASTTPISVYWKNAENPYYANESAKNIQDLLFLENRDRKYEGNVYSLRGVYTVSDSDFDLTQFGLFLNADTVYMTFHLNDMITAVGRKIMSGDVLELPHKKDYYPLDADVPAVLKRFYVVQDCTFSSEGFSQTWWPHLWRVKMTPLVDGQEYKDILNNITASENTSTPLGQVISTLDRLYQINDAIIDQAAIDVPKSGTNIDRLYIEPIDQSGGPGDPVGTFTDNTNIRASNTTSLTSTAPNHPGVTVPAYLGGDGTAPNGFTVTAGTSFPGSPKIGQYALRTDYVPDRLFRYDGTRWIKVEDAVRANLTPGPNNQTLRSTFVNDESTYTNTEGETLPTRQSLSKALTPKADN